jgi:hypothetical protein
MMPMNFYHMISRYRPLGYGLLLLLTGFYNLDAQAQEDGPMRGMTLEEYAMAREVTVEDPDHDTYIKFADGQYVLDRYEMKPPYFITGDSGVKKRIDLYKLIDRETMSELGLIALFTNTESGATFNLVIPNLATKGEVWNKYFDDIHQHDREEQDVALKMSYVLSKEVAYLLQKSSGVDMSAMEQADSDYDFCFPAQAKVTLPDGSQKKIADITAGETVVTFLKGKRITTTVTSVSVHKKNNIPLSKVILLPEETLTAAVLDESYPTSIVELVATANHPVMTANGKKTIRALKAGDILYRHNSMTQGLEKYTVGFVTHAYDSTQEIYNLTTEADSYLVDDVVVYGK